MRSFAAKSFCAFRLGNLIQQLVSLLLAWAMVMSSMPAYAGDYAQDVLAGTRAAKFLARMERGLLPDAVKLPLAGGSAGVLAKAGKKQGPPLSLRLATLKGAGKVPARPAMIFQGTPPGTSSIVSNFNGTAIPQGRFIWFTSVFKANGLPAGPARVFLRSSTITFTSGGKNYNLPVPDASITFSPTATSATTIFDPNKNEWATIVPSSGLAGNTFLSGVTMAAPVGGLPGGINPVTWSGTFYSDSSSVSINWQWAAAVYTSFGTDYRTLGVKPVDDNQASQYQNSDHAGTPESFKAFVTGGARGGGGSDYTGSYSGTASVVPINQVPNHAPVANAGPNQTVHVGDRVQLDGSGSTDTDGDTLTYHWAFASIPTGSAAALTGPTSVNPTFVADLPGTYTVRLIVNDGIVDSAPSTVAISTTNSPPVANAGPNQTTFVNTKVFLDGSRSTDVDGDPITYRWSLSVPASSAAVLSDAAAVKPFFTVDVNGTYVAQLIVNDGFADSTPAKVMISTVNSPPVANAGPDQSILPGTTVFLDGSGSTDVDGDHLTYRWAVISKPDGSNPALSDGASVKPSFFADQLGVYVVQLIVNDGTVDSDPSKVNITTENSAPVAKAGPAQTVLVGTPVTLDGTGSSDPDGQTITYKWSLSAKPEGSNAALADATSPHPTFTVDVDGDYVAQLIVNDGFVNSTPDTVTISTINSIPVANAGPNRVVRTGVVVQLDGSGSSDADHNPLTYRWAITVQPSGSVALLSSASVVRPTLTPDVVGTYVIQLIVNDGKVDSAPATVTIVAQNPNQPPAVSAGPDQSIVLPTSTVTMSGAATDDGLPDGILLIHWSQVSGPTPVTFTTPDQPVTQATFDVSGVYVLQLSASDTQFTSTSTVTVTVTNPGANLPPFVDAGPDQTIALPGIATFNGTVTDDGKPVGAALTSAWKLLSGPGAVIFSAPNSPQTTAAASAVGQYVLQLSGNDTEFTTTSNVNLIVTPPVIPNDNLPPVVNAGPNQTITLPTNTVTLNGSVTDDGKPAGGTLTQFWTAISGPGAVTFANSQAAVTTATFSAAGAYVLRLTATDSELTGSADAIITVNPDGRRLVGSIEVCYWCGIDFGFGLFQDGPIFIIHNGDSTPMTGGILKIGPAGGFTDSFHVATVPAGGFAAVAPGLSNDGGTGHNFFAFRGSIRDTSDEGPDTDNTQFQFTALDGSTQVDTGVFTPAATRGLSLDQRISINFLGLEDGPCNLCFDKIVANITEGTVNTNLALLTVTKTHSGSFAAGQQNATYTVTVSNATGAASTSGTVTVTETTPSGLSLVSMAGSGWTCAANACSRSNALAAGLSYPPITVTVNVAANATSPQVNRVIVSGGGSPNALASDATNITGAAKLPVVSAGAPQSITLPNSTATLTGSGSSDNGPLTFTWSKLSGPGTVTFSNANSAVTQATFSAVGSYLLQLAGSDGPNAATSNTIVTVNPAVNQPPVVSAGPDQNIQLPTNSLTLNGTASDDGLPTGAALTVNWIQISGPAAVFFGTPTLAVTTVSFPAAGIYVLRLTASDSQLFSTSDVHVVVQAAPQPLTVSAGPNQTITLPVNHVTLNGSANGGNGPLTFTWSEVSGPSPVTFGSATSAVTQATLNVAGSYVLQLRATDGATAVTSTATIVVNPGPLTVSAGPNQTITLPTNTVALNGSAIGGQGPLTLTWSEVSGPAAVTFSSPHSASTQATFTAFGSYVLQLTATDGAATVSATTTVTVNPTPIVVSAGANQTVTLPTNTIALNGSASGGGGTLAFTWSEASGPAAVTFSNPNAAVTQATFTTAGSYVLQLSATDGINVASASVTAAVNPPAAQPPVVSAGPNQTVTLPAGTVTLAGSATSSNGPITFAWSELSGPAAVTFSNPNSAVTQATFTVAGSYLLQLSANDTHFVVTATTTITVNPPPAPPVVSINLPEGAEITSPTQITGTVNEGTWSLQYALASGDGTTANPVFITFASGTTAVNNGLLGVLDPTTLLNGNYIIRLTATDQFGQVSSFSTDATVARNAKVGNFTLSFNDLTVPVAGLPITVTRTYDSREKRSRDFGIGWTLSISNVRLQKNGKLGANWQMTQSGGVLPSFCLAPTKPHIVTVTFPDNRVYKFQGSTSPQCQRIVPVDSANLTFTQMPGPANTQGASLQVVGDSAVLVDPPDPGPVDLLDFNTLDDANPMVFQLTTAEGFVYIIDQNLGVTSLTDPNGNRLVINANGVTSSAGKAVAFVRDAQGRIASITDPAGKSLIYTYNAAGDLTSFIDRAGNTTTFSYDTTHLLTNIIDPRGVQAIRNTYDAAGRLLSTTDASGNTTTFTHDVAANHEIVTDRLGNATLYEYDNDGNVTRVTDPLGNVTSATFDGNDNKLTETNALGKTTTFVYDAFGSPTSVTDPLNHITQYTYNSLRQPLVTTDPLHHTITNTYDARGNTLTTQDALGNTTTYTNNTQGLPLTIKDALGKTMSFVYDSAGNMSQQTDALGKVSNFTYDTNGNKLTQAVTRTKADGTTETLTTQYQYDGDNRLVRTVNPDGSLTQVVYNGIGKQSDTIDALGHKTHYDYDANGRLTRTTYADGTTEAFLYDANDRRLTSTDRAGHTTSYAYDAVGRLTKTTFVDNSFTQTVYDAAGQTIQSIDALNHITGYGYDDAGRRTSVTVCGTAAPGCVPATTNFAYDAAGNQTSITDALNHTTQFVYDNANRRIQTIYHDNSSDSVAYDALGRQSSKTDQAGKVTQYGYDALGRLTSVTQLCGTGGSAASPGCGVATTYAYDEVGNRISQTDANGHVTKFAYDQLGRRTSRTLPLAMSESYGYDATGNLTSKQDFNGHTTTYQYDTMNRLKVKTADAFFSTGACAPGSGGTLTCGATQITYNYNNTGRRTSMSDASGSTNYTYDTRDRLLTKAGPAGTLTYTYDAAGNTLTLRSSNAGGASMTYTYDPLNRLASVTDASGVTNYTYDAVGNLGGFSYPNGISTSYSYDTLNRLTQMQSTCGTGTPACAPGTSLSSYTYTLGPAGNRLSVAELSGRTVTYGYDDLYRLTSETVTGDPAGKNGVVGYTFDNVGNRLQRTSTLTGVVATGLLNYDANDRTTTDPYDTNGNLLSSGAGSNVYDFENHLVQAGGVKLVYDGDGNRVSETVANVTTKYLVADQNLTGYAQILDELQNGAVSRTYSYGLGLISQKLAASGSQLSFYLFDGHGSVRFLTSSNGAVTDTYDYDAFGNLIPQTGTTPSNYLFAGEQFDPALGIYYNRARYYDQRQGRFWTMDESQGRTKDPASLHKYLYAGADPTNKVDPSGHDFDLASFSVANSIATTINAAEGNVGLSVINGFGGCAVAQRQGQSCDVTKASLIDLVKNAAFSLFIIAGVVVAGKLLGLAKQSVSLRFSQDTASPTFSTAEGALFPGETIGSLASKIRARQIVPSQVPVHIVVRGNTALIFDTRSSLALMRAGVPQESWNFINATGDPFFEAEMTKRLLSNGLGEEGAEFVRITGLGQNASSLE